MNIINTTAPISIEDLKKFFSDKTSFFIIKYKDSSLKGSRLLTYLSNLDIPCDIDFEGCSELECFDMIKDYLHSAMIVDISSLENAAINILHQAKGLINVHDKNFIEENQEMINKWVSKLESLTLYNMHIIKDESFNQFIESFEKDESKELIGVNFISLLKHETFYSFYQNIDHNRLKFYTNYFNEYMFRGKNMYSYWATDKNPLFLLTYGIAENLIDGNAYNLAKQKTIQELENATPIQ